MILEDNLRIPSGITYQMKTTETALSVMPELSAGYDIIPYDIRAAYQEMFVSLCDKDSPNCVLLTDSKYGAAFFERRYLSELFSIPLVEGPTCTLARTDTFGRGQWAATSRLT